MIDPTALAAVGGALTALGALAKAFHEKSKRAALEAERSVRDAERKLEDERQQSQLQTSVLERLANMERRAESQGEVLGAQAVQIATLSAEKLRLQEQVDSLKLENAAQQQQMGELASDNVRLSGRVVQLEREKADAELKAKLIKREYRVSLGLKPDSEPPKG